MDLLLRCHLWFDRFLSPNTHESMTNYEGMWVESLLFHDTVSILLTNNFSYHGCLLIKGLTISKGLTCLKIYLYEQNGNFANKMLILLGRMAILLYELFMHHTHITLCPNR